MRIQSAAVFIACCAVPAAPCGAAETVTDGEKLLTYCAEAEKRDAPKINPFRAGFCMAFIEGTLRGWEARASIGNAPFNYCIPNGIKIGALVSTVTGYMRENPSARAGKAEISVIQAIQRAYPCVPRPK